MQFHGYKPILTLVYVAGALALVPGARADAPALELTGKLSQGALVEGRTQPGNRIELNGGKVQVDPEGRFLIGFGRDAPPQAELIVYSQHAMPARHVLDIEQRSYQEQHIDGLPGKMVSPPESALERIRREAALVAAARRISTPASYFASGFDWPIRTGIVTGVYGSRRVLNGEPRRPHYGIDIAAPAGTPVYAPATGVISLVHEDMYFTGGTLIIDHGHGLSSTMIHLQRVLVAEGEQVAGGQLVGEVGATGRATGPHLDWRINLFSTRLDPELIPGLAPFPKRR